MVGSKIDLKERVASALNEQGFLLQHRVADAVAESKEKHGHSWVVVTDEYPVTASDDKETRIDLVLANEDIEPLGSNEPRVTWCLCVECKRANRDYKAWVFFGDQPHLRGDRGHELHTEILARTASNAPGHMWHHRIERSRASDICPFFNSYIEVRLQRKGNRSSFTDTIEDAFTQTMRGMSGLAKTLREMQKDSEAETRNYLTPVVVTTAKLFRAGFDPSNVALDTGMIDKSQIKVEPEDFVAVNYHCSEALSLSPLELGHDRPTTIIRDMLDRQMRTVFVVRANCIGKFLKQLEQPPIGLI